MIPGVGEVFDVLNAGLLFLRGDCVGAFASLAAAVPFAGWLATGGKWGRRARACRILCFAAGTAVATPDGPRPIDDLAVGDLVIARDEDTGELVERAVTHTHVRPSSDVIELRLRDPATGDVETLRVTAEHPFWRRNDSWTPVEALATRDTIATAASTWLEVVELTSTNTYEPVYNITVADDHNVFVGDGVAWAHNTTLKGTCGTAFIGQSKGPSIVVPRGAQGPIPAHSGKGVQYIQGSGGPSLNPRVSSVRIMDPTPPNGPSPGYPAGYASYANRAGQTVNPLTGRTISRSDPFWHIPLNP